MFMVFIRFLIDGLDVWIVIVIVLHHVLWGQTELFVSLDTLVDQIQKVLFTDTLSTRSNCVHACFSTNRMQFGSGSVGQKRARSSNQMSWSQFIRLEWIWPFCNPRIWKSRDDPTRQSLLFFRLYQTYILMFICIYILLYFTLHYSYCTHSTQSHFISHNAPHFAEYISLRNILSSLSLLSCLMQIT
jgi:hypothetical protein